MVTFHSTCKKKDRETEYSEPAHSGCLHCAVRGKGPLFSIDKGVLSALDQHRMLILYKKGQLVFHEGAPGTNLYCVSSGRLKLYKTGLDGQQQIFRIAGAGEVLGYRSLLTEEHMDVSAMALEDAAVCTIDKRSFFQLLAKNPDFLQNAVKEMAYELTDMEFRALTLAKRPVRQRMAELLLSLQDCYGEPTRNGTHIDIRLTREEMAEMIGVTQETAIRLLSEFKKDGLIDVHERDITVLNSAALSQTAHQEREMI